MFLIDSTRGVNGETVVRKRRACRKCHRVNVVFAGEWRTCERCRLESPRITASNRCIAEMRLEREAERRSDEVFRHAMTLRAAFDADVHRNVG